MRCEHHPRYDPASGEPTGLLAFKERFIKGNPNVLILCSYCLQVYARHLCNLINEEDLEAFRNVDTISQLQADLTLMEKCHSENMVTVGKLQRLCLETKADLAKFGGHAVGCDFLLNDVPGWAKWKCDCGLAEAKERWG